MVADIRFHGVRVQVIGFVQHGFDPVEPANYPPALLGLGLEFRGFSAFLAPLALFAALTRATDQLNHLSKTANTGDHCPKRDLR